MDSHWINQLLGIPTDYGWVNIQWWTPGYTRLPAFWAMKSSATSSSKDETLRSIWLVVSNMFFLYFQIEQTMIPKPFRKNNTWLVVWNIWIIFPNSWDDDPIWRTHIFQRDWNHQLAIVHWRTAKPVGPACFAARIPSLSGVGASPCRIFLISYTSSSWPAICFSAGLNRTSRLGDKGIHP